MLFHYVKNNMGIADKQAIEVAKMKASVFATEQEKQDAKLDYIAMMADVDLSDIEPENEEMEGVYHEQEV